LYTSFISRTTNRGINIVMEPMDQINGIISIIVLWIIVPIILLGIIVLAGWIVKRTAEGEHRLSVKAGYWAGLIGFVAFVVYEKQSFHLPEISKAVAIELSLIYFGLAVCFGLFLLHILKLFIPTRLAGFVVLLLVFSGASSLFSYFFVQSVNDVLLSCALGVSLGVLLHVIVFPKNVHDIFGKFEDKKQE
jgi:hypothetical protein